MGRRSLPAREQAQLVLRRGAAVRGVHDDALLVLDDREWMAATVPLGRWAEPTEIAAAVGWLLSEASSYVAGHALVIDGGTLVQIAGPSAERVA